MQVIAEKNLQFGYINIYFGETSTLSSCCRLRSDTKNEYFNQFGAGGTKIGSLGVVTLNLPRIAFESNKDFDKFFDILKKRAIFAVKINNTKRNLLKKRIKGGALPLYNHDFMSLESQYSTTGINGVNEAVVEMGFDVLEKSGQDFILKILKTINTINDQSSKQYKAPHNCEQTPSENSAIKLASKDKLLGIQRKYNLYSNQFIPLTTNADMLDRIKLQGIFDGNMTGGAICHINIENQISESLTMFELMKACAEKGVVYFAINYNIQQCFEGHMSVGKLDKCVICGADIENNYTRVVGFLTNTKNWHKVRREEDYPNRVFY
jgi:ribonucleoside-triphosphate reductase